MRSLEGAVAAAVASAVLAAGLLACGPRGRAGAAELPAATEVAVGERFDVRLESNPSTGFSWTLRGGADGGVVRLVGSAFVPPPAPSPGEPPPVGRSGQEVFAFEAVAPGRTTLDFAYARSWEKGVGPEKVVAHVVRVR